MDNANVQERENLAALNQERQEDSGQRETKAATSAAMNEPPNIVITAIFLTLAIIGDLFGAIPIIGWIVSYPVLGIIWLWRFSRHQTGLKKDSTIQILTSSLSRLIPFAPTCIVLVLYTHGLDTKLGKVTIGKAQQLNKIGK